MIKDSVAGRTEWMVTQDGSVCTTPATQSVPDADQVEVVTGHPFYWERDMGDLVKIMSALRAAGAICDSSTGGHVHTDAGPLCATTHDQWGDIVITPDAQKINNLIQFLAANETLIAYAIGIHPNRAQGYGRLIRYDPAKQRAVARLAQERPRSWQDLRSIWSPQHSDSLNLSHVGGRTKNTIEYRMFNGTMDPNQQMAHIQLALAMTISAAESGRLSIPRARHQIGPQSAADFHNAVIIGLGMIGPEFKIARERLQRNLPGAVAFRDPTGHAAARPSRYDPQGSPGSQPAATGETVRIARYMAGITTPGALKTEAGWGASPAGHAWVVREAARIALEDGTIPANYQDGWLSVQKSGAKFLAAHTRVIDGRQKVWWIGPTGAGFAGTGAREVPWDDLWCATWKEAAARAVKYLEKRRPFRA
jgi:hypothetical protein